MQVTVDSKNFAVTKPIRAFARKQASKLNRVSKQVVGARFFLETNKKKSHSATGNSVTVQVQVPGKDIVVKKQAAQMYEAISKACDIAVRHLRKRYEKRRAVSRSSAMIER